MADMMSTLRGILGDGADDKIKNAMAMLSQSGILQQNESKGDDIVREINNDIGSGDAGAIPNSDKSFNSLPALTPEGLQILGQMKNMFDQVSNTNDSRSELLRSLRPFMRTERQRSIDRLIRIMNIGRISGLFGRQG